MRGPCRTQARKIKMQRNRELYRAYKEKISTRPGTYRAFMKSPLCRELKKMMGGAT